MLLFSNAQSLRLSRFLRALSAGCSYRQVPGTRCFERSGLEGYRMTRIKLRDQWVGAYCTEKVAMRA